MRTARGCPSRCRRRLQQQLQQQCMGARTAQGRAALRRLLKLIRPLTRRFSQRPSPAGFSAGTARMASWASRTSACTVRLSFNFAAFCARRPFSRRQRSALPWQPRRPFQHERVPAGDRPSSAGSRTGPDAPAVEAVASCFSGSCRMPELPLGFRAARAWRLPQPPRHPDGEWFVWESSRAWPQEPCRIPRGFHSRE